MALLNAQSIRNKMDLFRAMVASEKLDIIGVTESWIHEETRDYLGEFEIPGYKLFKKDRVGRGGGGVLLYVKETLNPIDCNIVTEHELIGISINRLDRCLHIFLCYRPPHQSQVIDESLYNTLGSLIQNRFGIILGDFNGHVNWRGLTPSNCEGKRLLEFANKEFLYQWVNEPTRGQNILDLVFTTEDNLISDLSVGEKLGNSDHKIVRLNVNVPHDSSLKYQRKLDFRRADYTNFRELVKNMHYSTQGDFDNIWKSFHGEFIHIQEKCIPRKRTSNSGNPQPKWFNSNIASVIKERDRAHKKCQQQPSQENIHSHKTLCRKVKKEVRAAKLNEERRVAKESKNNPKEFFAHVNSRKPVKNNIGPLKDENNKIVGEDLEMADLLNKYFASVFTSASMPGTPEPGIKFEGNEFLDKIIFSEEDIRMKIRKLNKFKAPGPDEFYPRVIKELEKEIAPHFYKIMRISAEQRIAASGWKSGNIAPIFKKGAKDSPSNYRPISLTSVVCKIFESIIADQIVIHLEKHSLMVNSQHGFRHNRSCLSNLLEFFHNMFSIYDDSRAIDILYLDFQKAFDKVPHDRLMCKVRALGIIGEVADWIENWLCDRKQRVVINGEASEWMPVGSGVPQGSVLGPLLFIIYINDIDIGLTSKIAKFADDTKLGIDGSSDIAVVHLQDDLKKLGEWSEKWQMPFNVGKCKVMHIGHNNLNANYELLGHNIESVDKEKDLGVVISKDLKFSQQCIEAERKAQKLVGYIKRQFSHRNKEIVLPLYNSIVRPHLEYAVQFWAPSLRKDIDRLEAVQARATKLIPSVRNFGYQRRLDRLNLFSLETRRLRGQLIETFKILKGFTNVDHQNLFTINNNRARGNGCKLELKPYNTNVCGNFFTFKICNFWNRLTAEVINSASIEEFKTKLDRVIHTLI